MQWIQRRAFFSGAEEALKNLKKRGAHPDVFRGKYPTESLTNEKNLPMLEEFIRTYGKVNEDKENVIKIYVRGDDEKPTLCELTLSHKWPKRKIMTALGTLLQLEKRDSTTGEVTTHNLIEPQLETTLDIYLRVHIKQAAKQQRKREKLRITIFKNINNIKTLYRIKLTTDTIYETTEDFLSNVLFIERLCAQNMKMRECHIHVASATGSKHKIGYVGDHVNDLGTLVLSIDHKTLPEIRQTWRQEWKHISNCIDWARLTRAYNKKISELDLFWKGMNAACQKVATSRQIASLSCRHVGPVLPGFVTPLKLKKFKKATNINYTGHDFVSFVGRVLKSSIQTSLSSGDNKSLAHPRREFAALVNAATRIELAPLELVFPPNIDENLESGSSPLFGLPIEEEASLQCKIVHTGALVIGVKLSDIEEAPDRFDTAINRFAVTSAVTASLWNDILVKTDALSKKYILNIKPSPTWCSIPLLTLLDQYSTAVDNVTSSVGILTAIGLYNFEIHISDEYNYDEVTGVITVPWDFTMGEQKMTITSASKAIRS